MDSLDSRDLEKVAGGISQAPLGEDVLNMSYEDFMKCFEKNDIFTKRMSLSQWINHNKDNEKYLDHKKEIAEFIAATQKDMDKRFYPLGKDGPRVSY